MSLINKVLLDLDNRTQSGGATYASRSLFSNLHPVGVPSSISATQWLWALCAGLLVFGLVGGGWYYYENGARLTPVPATIRTAGSQHEGKVNAPEKAAIASASAPVPPQVIAEVKPAPPPLKDTAPEPALAISNAPTETRVTAIIQAPAERAAARDITTAPAVPQHTAEAKPAPLPLENMAPEQTQITSTAAATPSEAAIIAPPAERASVQEASPASAPPQAAAETNTTSPPPENPAPDAARGTSSAPTAAREAAITSPPAAPASANDASAAPKEASSLERTLRPLSPDEKAENLYRKGISLFRAGQGQEGERALQAALAIDPSHTAARETLTVVLLENHRYEEAKHILSEGIALVPNYAPFSSRLARLYVEQGDDARALSLLERNRAQVTPDAAYLGLLGTLYQRASKSEEARDAFRQALRLQPDEGRWWMGLGISLEVLRDWAAARDAYQHCVMSNQTDPRVHQYAEQRLSIVSRHVP